MDFVTITDHDSLAGSLSIAHLPGTFLGAELDTFLPEDACRLHVVVLGVDEALFADLLDVRTSAYELSALLHATGTAHFVSHPLYAVNDRLTPDAVEKLLLLFDAFEVRNGARSARSNDLTEEILASLTPRMVERLAERHGIEPRGPAPWRKTAVGGSDDHSGLFAAAAWTEAPCDGTPEGFLEAVRHGDCGPGGDSGGAPYLAHSIYAVVRSCAVDLAEPRGERAVPGLGRILSELVKVDLHGGDAEQGALNAVARLFPGDDAARLRRRFEIRLRRDIRHLEDARTGATEYNRRLFGLTRRLADDSFRVNGIRLVDGVRRRRPGRVAAGAAGVALTHLAATPYYVAYRHQAKERPLLDDVRRRLLGPETSAGRGSWEAPAVSATRRIALFTDTIHEINGVALTIKRLLDVAQRRGIHLRVFTSRDEPSGLDRGIENLRTCGGFALPRYPELGLHAPSFLEVVARLQDGGYTDVHVSTPGPVGFMGLAAARVLKLPVAGTYHTDIPRYARDLGGSRLLEEVAWRYVHWFYSRLDEVLVPSASTRRDLIARGLPAERVKPLPRWVDTERFTPKRRDVLLWESTPLAGRLRVLYAGRVSREKNLELLATVFRSLSRLGLPVGLVVAGDGPFRAGMQESLRGCPAVFLGFQEQDALATTYASSDVFVFPSATDTFGNVVLEAQSSGLPVIVSDRGGPQELIDAGRTGFSVPADEGAALAAAMALLLTDEALRKRMGRAARAFCVAGAVRPEQMYTTILGPADDERSAGRVA